MLIYLLTATSVVVGAAALGYVVVDGSFGLFLLAFGAICVVMGLPMMRWVAVRIDRLRNERRGCRLDCSQSVARRAGCRVR